MATDLKQMWNENKPRFGANNLTYLKVFTRYAVSLSLSEISILYFEFYGYCYILCSAHIILKVKAYIYPCTHKAG
jgi:hypothetical protein